MQLVRHLPQESRPPDRGNPHIWANRLTVLLTIEEDLERHETIERAWKLYLRNKRESHERELRAKFQKMRQACSELELVSQRLFKAAQFFGPENRAFPKQMKIPTETPPLSGWNYNYVAPPPSVGEGNEVEPMNKDDSKGEN